MPTTFRTPGPMCGYSRPVDVDDGLLARTAFAPPAPLCSGATVNPQVGVEIHVPASGTVLSIDATGPTMPRVKVRSRLTGIFPDPSHNTEFFWSAQVRFDSVHTANGTKRSGQSVKTASDLRTGNWAGGTFEIAFDIVSGGDLMLEVWAFVGGRKLTGRTHNVRVQGTNPTTADVKAVIAEPVIGRILRFESEVRQFVADSTGEAGAMYPYFSRDRYLGAGLGQITPCPENALWNWRANVAAANAKFAEARRAAGAYPRHCRNSAAFRDLVSQWKKARADKQLPTADVMIPEFAAEQLERDAVRCYNGAAGSDNLGHNYLHEYRIVLDDNGALVADVGPGQATAVARWEVVPTDDRPDVGDPDYVNHVYGRSPL